ncbi:MULTISPECIES: cell wall-binding repeat-containing protein [unclassified Planococcus (in: firmicutes)]|uniref:cell wall-binding repeat-containing protein n=1 Tax=unclassified Planococcus (in: firmicutes) TaxID=2662419 RepID=UPI000C335DF1|nr:MULTISPECIES: cell wall-binding repeat-containing protein [unclassified Planococcus (in: firmicutes)]AUD14995.1 peptidase S8 [Planococcus sp. MB-3u-03]PKG47066.1 peptidase S8 [Planococcus sp. Urea-trap-24]PKG87805.1 peptidase S8 [Planococcus sp. Urea-3u-39]PKH35463.1 peptidase S8 [Planococcus sp. MB-3u-09]
MDRAFKIATSFLMGVSLFGVLPATQTAQAEDLVDADVLEQGDDVSDTFYAEDNEHWYRIDVDPEQVAAHTHFEVSLQSDDELTFTVYPDAERATADQPFDPFSNYSFAEMKSTVKFPIAWEGPYYIKVSSYAEELPVELPEGGEVDEASYTIGFDGVTVKASKPTNDEQCPAELVMGEAAGDQALLDQLRVIRGEVLSQTESGKELTKLYYKLAPFIGYQAVTDASVRDSLKKNLNQLDGLITSIAENGFQSSKTITAADQKAISELYALALKTAPANLKDDVEAAGQAININKLAGKSVMSAMLPTPYVVKDASMNKVIVKVKEGETLTKAEAGTAGIQSVSEFDAEAPKFDQFFVVDLKSGMSAASTNKTLQSLEDLPEVEFVEPVQQYKLHSEDIYYDEQWSLENKGGGFGIEDADIDFEEMTKLAAPQKQGEVITAVIDTGVDYTLADLKNQMISTGYDFINDDNKAFDDQGHGTHVSGIIAAEADNDYSMTGINQSTKILPVKVLDASGYGDTEQIAYGILYATDQGADIINMSLGGGYSRVLEYAMRYANERGVTIVAASGNDGWEEVSYPASSKYAIAVGATNKLDLVSDYSSYGKDLDVVAPGTDIPSLLPDGNVTLMSGTSMAAPHVAAVAGVLKSINPNLTPGQLENLLTASADDVEFIAEDAPPGFEEDPFFEEDFPYEMEELAPGFDLVSGWGRLNGAQAILALKDKWNLADRLSGESRYDTAVEVSKKGWSTSGKAVIATGGDFPDALSAAPLAAYQNAPLLLTKTDSLPQAVKDELKRLKVTEVTLIGGQGAISPMVEMELKDLKIKTTRISGKNRYETSVNIAKKMTNSTQAVVATGSTFADALSIAPVAGSQKMPILLTKPNGLPAEVKAHFAAKAYSKTFIVGGKGAVSDSTAKEIKNPVRLSGASRYETNSAVINHFKASFDNQNMYLSTGANYPDALAGSVLAAKTKAPLVLTAPNGPNAATVKTVQTQLKTVSGIYILGGEGALPTQSIQQLFE